MLPALSRSCKHVESWRKIAYNTPLSTLTKGNEMEKVNGSPCDPEKIKKIEKYLEVKFSKDSVRSDFKENNQVFKIGLPNRTRILKLEREFIDDHDAEEIIILFDGWSLITRLQNEPEHWVYVSTRSGLQPFLF